MQAAGHPGWPQCKWGRHCCRPHSHQRVVFLPCSARRRFSFGSAWRPMSFRVPEGPRSVTGARAGIRFHRWKVLLLPTEVCIHQPWAPSISPQPFDPLMAVPSGSLWPKPPFPFIPDRSLPAVSANFRILVIGWACVWPKPSASNPRKSRGQSLPHRLFWKSSGFSILSDENPGGFPSLSMD